MTRAKVKAQAMQVPMKMNLFRSKMVPDTVVTSLLRDGTLREHVLMHIEQFGRSTTDTYNVKVSGSGMITVGAAERFN